MNLKDKSHRQRIEDELMYCHNSDFTKSLLIDITICVAGFGFSGVLFLICLIAGVFNIFS